ncbi:FAD binding domain-containing protein [Colletotrichum graminicola]|nr:FAD binding domain-containing protein [Colletotrichum graminicola]
MTNTSLSESQSDNHRNSDVIDVLISGAGPVGLALALDLGRRGVRSTIIEKKPEISTQILAKASVLDERTMEYCRRLGIRDAVVNSGYPADLPADTIYCTSFDGHYIGRLEMPSALEREIPEQTCEMMRRCPQMLFDPILARAVKEQGMATVRYSSEVVSAEQDADSVTCAVKHVDTGSIEYIRGRFVVACDGASSFLRKTVDIGFEGQDLGFAFSAIVLIQDLHSYHNFGAAAERYLFIGPEGTWANFTTIDGHDLWRFTVAGSGERVDPDTVDLKGILRKAIGREDVPFEILRVNQWRRSQYTASKYRSGRIFLAGDSAHTMSPTGGHGLNTGLGDASDLSWILQAVLGGWGGPEILDAYEIERRPVAIRNGVLSSRNFGLWKERQGRDKVLDSGPVADEQRRVLGTTLALHMRQEFQSIGLALGYNYAHSPVVVTDGSPAPEDQPDLYIQTARPGHRAPHFWLEDGRSSLDIFGQGFVLLAFGTGAGTMGESLQSAASALRLPLKCVEIKESSGAQLYQRKLVLVRPDGMVAWRGDLLPNDVTTLLRYVTGHASV